MLESGDTPELREPDSAGVLGLKINKILQKNNP